MAGLGKADIDACLAVMQGQVPNAVVNRHVLDAPVFQAVLAGYAKRFG